MVLNISDIKDYNHDQWRKNPVGPMSPSKILSQRTVVPHRGALSNEDHENGAAIFWATNTLIKQEGRLALPTRTWLRNFAETTVRSLCRFLCEGLNSAATSRSLGTRG